MEVAEKCTKCSAAFGKLDAQVCSRCGWDSQIGMRKCVKCKSAVVLHEKPGFGPIGGLAGISAFVFWYFFKLLLGGAIASIVTAVSCFITAVTLSYACSDCGKKPETRLLDEDEKEDFKKRRMGFLLAGAGLSALGVLLLVAWVAVWRSALSGR